METTSQDCGVLSALRCEPHAAGTLSGLDVVVKDVFDIAGTVTGFGNPDWARLHGAATADAAVVSRLRDAGARITGKTTTVEFTFGLEGTNHWYPTPRNAAAPGRLPGGSSCGSASAVAAGRAGVGLGSDTGGSVRIPASYCGLFGIRPSQGAISLLGAMPYAPSLDVPGWLCRDAQTLRRVGDALLPCAPALDGGLLLLREAFDNARPEVAEALGRVCERLAAAGWSMHELGLAGDALEPLREAMADIHGREVWQSLGAWIDANGPAMGAHTAQRMRTASRVDAAAARSARSLREAFRERMQRLLGAGAVLVFPTSPCVAPPLDAAPDSLDELRRQTQRVTAIAGLAGLPEVSLPAARIDGLPVGLSLVAAAGRDRALLDLAERLWRDLADAGVPERPGG